MKVLVVWLVVCGIWGSNWIFIKFGLADLPPVSFAAWRLAVAVAILLLILAANKRAFPREKRFWILAGVTGFFNFFLNFALVFGAYSIFLRVWRGFCKRRFRCSDLS